jgi:3-hydroxyacyl-CoA dehydrogenase/enoyl-CoA hydratase/3-hydroxybutyryl-CoA epimerase
LAKGAAKHHAALRALEATVRGSAQSEAASLAGEAEAFLELIATESTRNLLRLYFLEERARKLAPAESGAWSAKRIAVIGAGTMGAGIAYWASTRGLTVGLVDADPEALTRASDRLAKLYEASVRKGMLTKATAAEGRARINPGRSVEQAVADADVVIEAVVEKMEVKRALFQTLDSLMPAGAWLGSNTSALSISELAGATTRPERVVGLHFFNPVPQMRLVEVVAGAKTDVETLRMARQFVQQIGKLPVLVRDSPGFIVNRVLFPYLIEAVRLLEAGAPRDEIDGAMIEFGMAMGPLRVLDEVGQDIALVIASTLEGSFGGRARAPERMRQLAAAGRLGRKAGAGFYMHEKGGGGEPDLPAEGAAGFARSDLRQRLIFIMINEAARCLEEKEAAEPGDIDLAMNLGTGNPGFRGGPLRYDDVLGIGRLVSEMERLAGCESRFVPCDSLRELAGTGGKIYSD